MGRKMDYMGKYEIFDEMIEGVQVIDENWRYVYANQAVAKHAKLDQSDLVGSTMMEKFPGIEKSPLFKLLQECMKQRKADEWLNEFEFPDGTKGYFELRIRPVEDGLLILSFDISSQKRAEEIIRKSNLDLEKLVEIRTKEILDQKILIEEQTAFLKELNQTKDKFFNIIAHDLRSPLHSLQGLASLIIDGFETLSKDEIKKLSEGLRSTVENTISLTDNLIEWARIQIREFDTKKEKVDLVSLLNDVGQLYQDQARKKDISFSYSIDQTESVLGDKNQITFIIRNLVNNAIKYTKPKGIVEILTVSYGKNKIAIKVKDNGIGMSGEIKKRLLSNDFIESQDGTEGEKGTAMGLKLCMEFAKLNGGRIKIDSKPNEGSTISLILSEFESSPLENIESHQLAS